MGFGLFMGGSIRGLVLDGSQALDAPPPSLLHILSTWKTSMTAMTGRLGHHTIEMNGGIAARTPLLGALIS